jgi:hypothetical protein
MRLILLREPEELTREGRRGCGCVQAACDGDDVCGRCPIGGSSQIRGHLKGVAGVIGGPGEEQLGSLGGGVQGGRPGWDCRHEERQVIAGVHPPRKVVRLEHSPVPRKLPPIERERTRVSAEKVNSVSAGQRSVHSDCLRSGGVYAGSVLGVRRCQEVGRLRNVLEDLGVGQEACLISVGIGDRECDGAMGHHLPGCSERGTDRERSDFRGAVVVDDHRAE